MKKSVKDTGRSSNFELLRLLAMLGIVVAHIVQHGVLGVELQGDIVSKQSVYLNILMYLGWFGNWIFFMLAGYFLVKKEFKFERLKKIVKETWFYSVLGFVLVFVLSFIGITQHWGYVFPFNFSEILKAVFPVITVKYWFITTYIILICLAPVINSIIKKISRNRLKCGLIIVSSVYFILQIILFNLKSDVSLDSFGYILPATIAYSVAGYVGLYQPKIKFKNIITLSVFWIAITLFVVWQNYYSNNNWTLLYGFAASYITFIAAILIFLFFRNLNFKNKTINYLAGSTFAVYLIHANPYILHGLWQPFDNVYKFGVGGG